MKIGVLGTGMVAKALAGKLGKLGHEIKLGTRDVKATLARSEPDMAGGPPLRTWLEANPQVALGTHAEAAAHGEIVINALSGQGALPGLESAGADALAGKVLIDISNPLDFSKGMPPSLFISNTDSLAEQIQRAFPGARVVKALNTIAADVMVDPAIVPGDHDTFVCGNDAGAKDKVRGILTQFGWETQDMGSIEAARAIEPLCMLWCIPGFTRGIWNHAFKMLTK